MDVLIIRTGPAHFNGNLSLLFLGKQTYTSVFPLIVISANLFFIFRRFSDRLVTGILTISSKYHAYNLHMIIFITPHDYLHMISL